MLIYKLCLLPNQHNIQHSVPSAPEHNQREVKNWGNLSLSFFGITILKQAVDHTLSYEKI